MKPRILIAAVAAALAFSSCSSQPAQAAQVCVDPVSNLRVDDSMCAHPIVPGVFIWWYITSGYTIPAYGWPVAYGYATPPRHTVIVNNVQSSGGVYPKQNRRSTTPAKIQPTSAATQAPPPKRQSWGKPAQPVNKPPAQSQPRTQTQPKWQQYKPPPASRPVQPKPPSYPKYR